MKTREIPFLIILTALLASGCYSHEKVAVELGKPKFTFTPSTDPVDHYRYEVYQQTGLQILYEYAPLDYRWNLGALLQSGPDTLKLPKDRESLELGLKYLERTLLEHYSDEFKRKYMPLRIFLADSITYAKRPKRVEPTTIGRDYIAIGEIAAPRLKAMEGKQLKTNKGKINAALWAFIFKYELMEFPEEFFAPSADYYDSKIANYNDKSFEPKKFGFWSEDRENSISAKMAPSQTTDLMNFIEMITSHSREEIQELIQGYETMQNKYLILTNHFLQKYQIDLQAIGEKIPQPLVPSPQ